MVSTLSMEVWKHTWKEDTRRSSVMVCENNGTSIDEFLVAVIVISLQALIQMLPTNSAM
jgi:hypothetical protein